MRLFGGIRDKATVLGIACGVLCACCVFLYLQDVNGKAEEARAEALARYGGEQLQVCVAAHDLSVGTTIGANDVQTKLWVVDLLPADAVRNSDQVIGRQVTSPILEGEVISLKRFEEQAFSIEVPEGLSAVSVPAKAVQAVGGALSPGMKVDIYATGDSTTSRIGQDVLVLATSASASGGTGDAAVSWITVAISPKLVQEFVIAAQDSRLYFVLPGKEVPSASKDPVDELGNQEEDARGSQGSQEQRSTQGAQSSKQGTISGLIIDEIASNESTQSK